MTHTSMYHNTIHMYVYLHLCILACVYSGYSPASYNAVDTVLFPQAFYHTVPVIYIMYKQNNMHNNM